MLGTRTLHRVDIDTDPLLVERYGEKVPVLYGVAEEVICHYFLDPESLHRYFAKY